jgi:4'-phosphopantetheinyl transferase
MVRESRPHDVFIRTVRGRLADLHAELDFADPTSVGREQVRLSRFVGETELQDSSATSVLARHTLAGYMLREGSRLATHSAAHRPANESSVGAASPMRFSFSRADGIAVCALSAGDPVGVSVESVRRVGPDPLGVSAAICSGREREMLAATPPSGRPWRLLVMWTLKEAIAKAVGLGLRFPLQRITIGDTRRLSTRVLDALIGGRAAEWRFATWRPTPLHVSAVAVRCVPGTQIRFSGELGGIPATRAMPATSRATVGDG